MHRNQSQPPPNIVNVNNNTAPTVINMSGRSSVVVNETPLPDRPEGGWDYKKLAVAGLIFVGAAFGVGIGVGVGYAAGPSIVAAAGPSVVAAFDAIAASVGAVELTSIASALSTILSAVLQIRR